MHHLSRVLMRLLIPSLKMAAVKARVVDVDMAADVAAVGQLPWALHADEAVDAGSEEGCSGGTCRQRVICDEPPGDPAAPPQGVPHQRDQRWVRQDSCLFMQMSDGGYIDVSSVMAAWRLYCECVICDDSPGNPTALFQGLPHCEHRCVRQKSYRRRTAATSMCHF